MKPQMYTMNGKYNDDNGQKICTYKTNTERNVSFTLLESYVHAWIAKYINIWPHLSSQSFLTNLLDDDWSRIFN